MKLREWHESAGGVIAEEGGAAVVEHFGDWRAEYDRAATAVGVLDRSWRGLIEGTGDDRAAWLHNLVSNEIRNLQPGEGNYAFAISAGGRTLFDLCCYVERERLWLDVDLRCKDAAIAHFNKYIIMDDVTLTDRSADFARLAVLGPKMGEVAAAIGPANAATMAQHQHVEVALDGGAMAAIRHDFAGVPAVEYVVPVAQADGVWKRLVALAEAAGGGPVGRRAAATLQAEAGIPEFGRDIDGEVIPPETLQVERGISYHKGCYLGQEVIERMRSHNVLAKRLVALRVGGDVPAVLPAPLQIDGKDVGRAMSVCESPALGGLLGVGYLKTAHAKPGTRVALAGDARAVVVAFPRQMGA